MKRYESLDWLRGLMAVSIMIYHYITWKFGQLSSESLLGVLGIYGVSIFFVLSGLSMAIVYNRSIKDYKSSFIFFIRRLFRLLPLLWICILAVVVLNYINGNPISTTTIFLNLTLLFGFIAPNEYINIGAWSIGNESFYYAFTPLIIMAFNKSTTFGNLITAITVAIGMYFCFYILNDSNTLASQWNKYIHPFNNFMLFICGIALFYNFHNINIKNISYILIIMSIFIFSFYPTSGDQISIVTGTNRIVFTIAAILITLGFYKLTLSLPSIISFPLANLGEATYGV